MIEFHEANILNWIWFLTWSSRVDLIIAIDERTEETFHDNALDFESCEDRWFFFFFFPSQIIFFKKKRKRKEKNLETFVEKKFGKYLHAKRRPRGWWRGAEYVYEFARKAFE